MLGGLSRLARTTTRALHHAASTANTALLCLSETSFFRYNPRLKKELCSELFHTRLAWTENGHDCGDLIPCGDYVFDHRNQSLREWIVEEFMLGTRLGLGNRSAVDGFLIDDWWTLGGPSEVVHFSQTTLANPDSRCHISAKAQGSHRTARSTMSCLGTGA